MLYDFESGEGIRVEEDAVQGSKQIRGSDNVATSVTLSAVSLYFRADTSQVALKTLRLDYDTYCGLPDKPSEAGGRETAERVDLGALLENDLLLRQADNASGVTEEALDGS